MTGATVLELCAGYGGLSMGLQQVIDCDVVAVSEIDRGACAVLEHRYPEVPNIGDMTAADFREWRGVDWIIGGTPCQDVSQAGGLAGMVEGTRSGLWSHMARAIGEARPRHVLWENVRGVFGAPAGSVELGPWDVGCSTTTTRRAISAVVGDLSRLGYDARWGVVRASDVGAPHLRARVFILTTDALRDGSKENECAALANSTPRNTPAYGAGPTDATSEQPHQLRPRDRASLERCPTTWEGTGAFSCSGDYWAQYAPAVRRWERITGRTAPAPVEPGRSRERLSPVFVEWMMGLPAGWVTDVPGLNYTQKMRLLGNGVVPRQAALAVSILAGLRVAP